MPGLVQVLSVQLRVAVRLLAAVQLLAAVDLNLPMVRAWELPRNGLLEVREQALTVPAASELPVPRACSISPLEV